MSDHRATVKDPHCCLLDRIRAGQDGFSRGALVTLRSLHYAVKQLSKEDALELIMAEIQSLEAELGPDEEYVDRKNS